MPPEHHTIWKLGKPSVADARSQNINASDFLPLLLHGRIRSIKVVSLNDKNFFANVYLAGIYDDEGSYDPALKFYERVIAENDDYYYAFPAMGKIYYIKGDWKRASDMYVKASFSRSQEMTYPLMASICFTLDGDSRSAKSILNDNIGKLDRKSSIYEMYRYYLSPSSPYFVQLAIDNERNDLFRDRMKYYLAMMDKINGHKETAGVIFSEIGEKKGAYEFILAAIEMEN